MYKRGVMAMKKTYIICFLCVLLLTYAAYKITYISTVKECTQEYSSNIASQLQTVDAKTNNLIQINTKTEFIYETYNINTKELTYKTTTGPIEYLGYTREMLITEIKNQDYPENVVKVELITFSQKEVVIRSTIAYEITADYYVKAVDEALIIYLNDRETIYDYASIDLNEIPEELRDKLLKGMYIETTEDLYEFLQNFSS